MKDRRRENTKWSGLLTEFDRKAGGELHLNKLPEFIKVLEGCDHLQNIQQPEGEQNQQMVTDGSNSRQIKEVCSLSDKRRDTFQKQKCKSLNDTRVFAAVSEQPTAELKQKTHDSMPRGKS